MLELRCDPKQKETPARSGKSADPQLTPVGAGHHQSIITYNLLPLPVYFLKFGVYTLNSNKERRYVRSNERKYVCDYNQA